MSLEVKKGDLFKGASEDAILLHACNCQGSWRAGIATQFAKRFPDSHQSYKTHCYNNTEDQLLGKSLLAGKVACLFTSKNYGRRKDYPSQIVKATYTAVKDLLEMVHNHVDKEKDDLIEIHSPKINNGLFQVPWEDTEDAIKRAIDESDCNVKWIVWEL